jgi:hypothetical protein
MYICIYIYTHLAVYIDMYRCGRGAEGAVVKPPSTSLALPGEREFFIDNLLVRIHLIISIILVDRPCAVGV